MLFRSDYASLSNIIRKTYGSENSPVIAFGGSYGGMLSSWLRIMYPSAVVGGISKFSCIPKMIFETNAFLFFFSFLTLSWASHYMKLLLHLRRFGGFL